MKWSIDPRAVSSAWITKHITSGEIGIENIPIYQYLPDYVLKEYYQNQEKPKVKTRHEYAIIDEKTNKLPQTIIVSNASLESNYFKDTQKKDC